MMVSNTTALAMKIPNTSNITREARRPSKPAIAAFLPFLTGAPNTLPRDLRSSAITLVAAKKSSKPPMMGETPEPTHWISVCNIWAK